jgi:hypothetical protein
MVKRGTRSPTGYSARALGLDLSEVVKIDYGSRLTKLGFPIQPCGATLLRRLFGPAALAQYGDAQLGVGFAKWREFVCTSLSSSKLQQCL